MGRVVIPNGIREYLGLEEGSDIDIILEEDHILIKPVGKRCTICHNRSVSDPGHTLTNDLWMCTKCAAAVKEDLK